MESRFVRKLSWFLFGVLCLLYVVRDHQVVSADDADSRCDAIKQPALNFIYEGIVPRLEEDPALLRRVKDWIHRHVGVDLLDEREVDESICRFAYVRSVDELSNLLGEDYESVYEVYHKKAYLLFAFGTIAESQRRWNITKEMTFLARSYGFPRWPVGINYQLVLDDLSDIAEEYGDRFLLDMLEYVGFPKVDLANEELDLKQLAKAVSGAGNIKTFALISGLRESTVKRLYNTLVDNMSPTWPAAAMYTDLAYEFYVSAEEVGLLPLN